jgi:hypothetical protein
MLVISQIGLIRLLANGLNYGAAAFPQRVGLYTNNIVPTVNDTLATYTEPVAAWYARQALSGWTFPAYAAPFSSSVSNPLTWTNTGAIGANVTIYGYFVVDSAGALCWAERDPSSPIVILGGGGSYSLAPKLTYRNP